MIARTWAGKVPTEHAEGFHRHLLETGVKDYRRQPGCLTVALWRRDALGWSHFLLSSTWRDLAAIRAYAGDAPERAVLYPEDEAFGLVPDDFVTHYQVLSLTGAGQEHEGPGAG
jgi:quinol monooxygenase YgiN